MKKILITGGCGFIGSNLILFLRKHRPNWQIVNLDKLTYAANPQNLKILQGDQNYRFVKGDISDANIVERVFAKERPEAVIAMAAESHVDRSILHPDTFLKTNIFGTYVLLETARKYQVKRFIQIGTDEEYGSIEKGSFQETSPLSPASPYSASKAAASLLALSFYKTYGLPIIVTRSSNNFGPFQFPEKFIPRLITNAILGQNLPVYGRGKNVRDWIFVEDNCRGILLVLEKGKAGEIYNIGGGNEKTNLEIAQKIAAMFPRSKIEFVADRPGHDFRYSLNCQKIQKLGYQKGDSFENNLLKTIRWYQENVAWWKELKEKSEALYQNWGKAAK